MGKDNEIRTKQTKVLPQDDNGRKNLKKITGRALGVAAGKGQILGGRANPCPANYRSSSSLRACQPLLNH